LVFGVTAFGVLFEFADQPIHHIERLFGDLQCGEPGGRRPHHRFGVKQFPQRLLVDDMDETADSPRERCAWLRLRPARWTGSLSGWIGCHSRGGIAGW
jgi:hypothetical protein